MTAVRLKVANSVPNVTEAGGYDVRCGPGHRPRVITKAVGDRDGVGTMGRPGPEYSPPEPDTGERRVLDGSGNALTTRGT